jgi:hypothetical protein
VFGELCTWRSARVKFVEQSCATNCGPPQTDLVAAARKQDGAAALSVSDASLDNATQRIRALPAAQQDGESTGAL